MHHKTKNLMCVFLLVLCTMQCHCEPFTVTTVEDFAVFNRELYVLIMHEVGFHRNITLEKVSTTLLKQVVVLAKVPLTNAPPLQLQFIVSHSIVNSEFIQLLSARLCSTNNWIAEDLDGGIMRSFRFKGNDMMIYPQPVINGRYAFTANRKFLYIYQDESRVLQCQSLQEAKIEPLFIQQIEKLRSGRFERGDQFRLADSLDVLIIQKRRVGNDITYVRTRDRGNWKSIKTPDISYRLDGVMGDDSVFYCVCISRDVNFNEFVSIINADGDVIAKTDIYGDIYADTSSKAIYSIATRQASELESGVNLPVKVWFPFEKRHYTLNVKTDEFMKTIRAIGE